MRLSVCAKRVMLDFPGRDAERRNMSPSLMSAMGGVLSEEAVGHWEGKRGEVVEGWEELLGKMMGGGEGEGEVKG